jgi:hypothetical protein
MAAWGLGCVKTQTLSKTVEYGSLNQLIWLRSQQEFRRFQDH